MITTGSQGEPMSALTRIAMDDHKQIKLEKGDTVILSSRFIPGNEKTISDLINHLYRRGAEVYHEKVSEVHVSGHASQEELKLLHNLVRPRFFVPVHGEYRHLVHHARLLLQQAERMHGELAQYAEGIRGQVRLMSNTNALTEFLPEPLSDFLSSHPQVNIDLEERLSDEIVAAVADGTADIGIVAGTVGVAGLETLPFRTDRFVLVVAPSHLLATLECTPFAEVLDCDFVGLDRSSALQRFLAEKAERIGRRLKLRVQLRSFDAVCRLVECDVGIGVVPATTAERHAKTMSIRKVELLDDWAVRTLMICIRREADLPIHARELVRHLVAK